MTAFFSGCLGFYWVEIHPNRAHEIVCKQKGIKSKWRFLLKIFADIITAANSVPFAFQFCVVQTRQLYTFRSHRILFENILISQFGRLHAVTWIHSQAHSTIITQCSLCVSVHSMLIACMYTLITQFIIRADYLFSVMMMEKQNHCWLCAQNCKRRAAGISFVASLPCSLWDKMKPSSCCECVFVCASVRAPAFDCISLAARKPT